MQQYLGNRLAIDPELARSFPSAQTLTMTRQLHSSIKIHSVHPPPSIRSILTKAIDGPILVRRRNRTNRPLHWGIIAPPFSHTPRACAARPFGQRDSSKQRPNARGIKSCDTRSRHGTEAERLHSVFLLRWCSFFSSPVCAERFASFASAPSASADLEELARADIVSLTVRKDSSLPPVVFRECVGSIAFRWVRGRCGRYGRLRSVIGLSDGPPVPAHRTADTDGNYTEYLSISAQVWRRSAPIGRPGVRFRAIPVRLPSSLRPLRRRALVSDFLRIPCFLCRGQHWFGYHACRALMSDLATPMPRRHQRSGRPCR